MKFQIPAFLSLAFTLRHQATLAACPDGLPVDRTTTLDLGTIQIDADQRRDDRTYAVEATFVTPTLPTLGLYQDDGLLLGFDGVQRSIVANLEPGTYVYGAGGGPFFLLTDNFGVLDSSAQGSIQILLETDESSLPLTGTAVASAAYFCFTLDDSTGPVDAIVNGANDLLEDVNEVVESAIRDLNCPDGIPEAFNTVFLGQVSEGPVTISIDTFGSNDDTELALWDEDGEILAANDDANGGLESEIVITLEEGVYVAGGSQFNVFFGDDFLLGGDGISPGDVMEYVLTISDSEGNSLVSDSVTLEGTVDGTVVSVGVDTFLVKTESVLFCFSVGETFTADEALESFQETSEEVVDTFFDGLVGILDNVLRILQLPTCLFLC